MVTAKMLPVRFSQAAHQRFGGVDAEGVVFVVGHVAARPHEDTNFVFELHHVFGVGRLDKNKELQVRHVEVPESAERNKDEVVLAHAESGAHLLRHADNAEALSPHQQFLVKRIDLTERACPRCPGQ